MERLDVRRLPKFTGASGSFENILKVLPGVHSSNELTSQYSVRGGSYDENLVYVNGVEILRPMLTRTGQQEGLSFVNPHLVSSVEFSTGGFAAEYGDKLSSVLSVAYRQPTALGGSAEASLLGASAACDFALPSAHLGGSVALRHKQSAYLLGTLDTKGEYNPTFSDVQATLYLEPSKRLSLHLMGSYGLNRYEFTPTERRTTFGTLSNLQDFIVYYEGSEHDQTQNLLGALTARYRPTEALALSFTASATAMVEQESYDVLGEYWLRQASSEADVSRNEADIGVGGSLDHARSHTATTAYTAEHRGAWGHRDGALKWGLKALRYRVRDELSQWQRTDSAGYMLPHADGALRMASSVNAEADLAATQLSAFAQEAYDLHLGSGRRLRITPGLRLHYATLSRELLVAPRLQVVLYPSSSRDLQLFAAAGAYHQPAFFKEMKKVEAQRALLNPAVAAQRSWHFTLGASALFTYYDIPCRLTAEAYYKRLYDLIPYRQDNVALLYDWERRADGYALGADAKLSAELVKGAESWVSLSVMQAQQDVRGDSYRDADGAVHQPGYFPMPNDQRLNLSVMLQDHLPGYLRWRAYLLLTYGTGLPAPAPAADRYDLHFRMPAYQRADVGFSYVPFDELAPSRLQALLGGRLRSCTFTVEVLNLFNARNVSSYLWVQTVPYAGGAASTMAVPGYLTLRRVNAKVSVTF
jgi:hypothetical protein